MQTAGNGLSFYSGVPYQKGNGFGSFLAGLFRVVSPLLRSGGLAIGKEVARGAAGMLADISDSSNVQEAFQRHSDGVVQNLRKRAIGKLGELSGSGYKNPSKKRKLTQSPAKRQKKKTVKKVVKKTVVKKRATSTKKSKSKSNLAAKRFDYFSG